MPIIITLSMVVINLIGYWVNIDDKKIERYLHSFLSGISVSYLFLIVFPEISQFDYTYKFFFMTFGFIIIHILQSGIVKFKDKKSKELLSLRLHELVYVLYNILATMVVIEIFQIDPKLGIIVLISVFFHSLLNRYVLDELGLRNILEVRLTHLIISISPIIGLILSSWGNLTELWFQIIFSFSAGFILYISIREEIPKNNDRNPLMFLFGSMLIAILIII